MARELSCHGSFSAYIVQEPNDEMVVEAYQIGRLWKQLDIVP